MGGVTSGDVSVFFYRCNEDIIQFSDLYFNFLTPSRDCHWHWDIPSGTGRGWSEYAHLHGGVD
jgi:hypothetical protein